MKIYQYSPSEWLLFFYIYCFCGWVWECCYVSIKKKEWVNRGFLHGPFLPIYGSGAICVLLMTIPVKNHLSAVFFIGMIGATVLEYITGSVMEKIFGVRYWDYSESWLNLHGYICLGASICWGVFSVILIRFAQPYVERLVFLASTAVQECMAVVLTAWFAIDFTRSFQEAMDLKELMVKLTEKNEEIKRLQRRMDVMIAVLNDEKGELKERVVESLCRYRETLKDYKVRSVEKKLEFLETAGRFSNLLSEQIQKKNREEVSEHELRLNEELEGMRMSLRKVGRFEWNNKKELIRSKRILRRNPGAFSKIYEEALKEMREFEKK